MNTTIVSEFVKAVGNNPPPEVEMKMTMEDSTTPGYERIDYEFVNKVKIGWKPGVNHELAMKIYDRLCYCRDMEIGLVWKRAVFLTAFIIAAFASYGGMLTVAIRKGFSLPLFYGVTMCGIGISCVGVVLSLMWIMMSKGSKAWYEHYEQAISAFAAEYLLPPFDKFAAHDWLSIPKIKHEEMSDNLFNTHGGAYSVSRVSVMVGQLALSIWCAVSLAHVVAYCFVVFDRGRWLVHPICVLIVGVLFVISTAIACKKLGGWLSSKHLQKVAKLPVA